MMSVGAEAGGAAPTAAPREPAATSALPVDSPAAPPTAAPAAPAPTTPAPAVPMAAALMRNAHEVVRADLGKVLGPAVDRGDVEAAAAAWRAASRFMATHAAMEDGAGGRPGFFALLNQHSGGAVDAAGVPAEHAALDEAAAALDAAFAEEAKNVETSSAAAGSVAAAFAAYRAAAEAHLEHEERVMMPIVAGLPNPKAPLVASHGLAAAEAAGDAEWYVAHGVATLAAHGSGANGPATAARVWVHALQAVCSPAQWAVYLPVARAAAGEAVWRGMLAEAPGLEGPGLLAAAA